MPAYFGTWSLISDQAVPPELVALSRKLVGSIIDIGVPARQWRLDDGSTISALIVNGIPKVTIKQVQNVPRDLPETTDLWVPRGFLVYPAWTSAPFGVGLPIIPDTSKGAYDPVNLAPGLDVSRWTPGGPCGEVLISQDLHAGYPTDPNAVVVPLLFDPVKGPVFRWNGDGFYDQRDPDAAWQSYRMELAAPVANYGDESVGQSEALFEQVNTYRSAHGQVQLHLLPRGYYRPAKIMSSIMLAAASTDASNAGYPATYMTPADRLTKDGYSAVLSEGPFTSWNRGDNPTAFELRAFGGTAASVVTGWSGDVDSNASLLKDVGPAAFADTGYRAGYWCADVIERTSWIEAGNWNWQSTDTSLPALSWYGFASQNMAWETYPALYDPDHFNTTPLVPNRLFTDTDGNCWLSYPRNTSPKSADMDPAMSRHIFCRGRAIATAPRGGLIWGACSTRVDQTDRLIALVHHPEDQPDDSTNEGFCRYLRVWWCDVPSRSHLRLDPQETICGEDVADAWGWRGGQLIDLGVMPAPAVGFVASDGINSLKYASAWRFSSNGTRAICLRDYGAFIDYAVYGAARTLWSDALNPRAVELVLSATKTDLVTSVLFSDYTAGGAAEPRDLPNWQPPDTQDVFNIPMREQGAVPIAVDYNGNGSVVFAYSAKVIAGQTSTYVDPDDPSGASNFADHCTYSYVGIGSADVAYCTDLQFRMLHGARFQTDDTDAYDEQAVVLDVLTATFAAKVTMPRFRVDPANATLVDQIDRPCQTFTDEAVDGVRLMRFGRLVREDWYPSPDGALFTVNDRCFTSTADSNLLFVYLPPAVSGQVQGHYASRGGEVVYGYQCAPLPLATPMLTAEPSSSACGCWVTNTDINATQWMTNSQLNPRGGAVVSSVPLPANDWLIYSKVL